MSNFIHATSSSWLRPPLNSTVFQPCRYRPPRARESRCCACARDDIYKLTGVERKKKEESGTDQTWDENAIAPPCYPVRDTRPFIDTDGKQDKPEGNLSPSELRSDSLRQTDTLGSNDRDTASVLSFKGSRDRDARSALARLDTSLVAMSSRPSPCLESISVVCASLFAVCLILAHRETGLVPVWQPI